MSSIERTYNITTLTDGTFIGINVGATNTAYLFSNFNAPTHSVAIGGEGSVYDYQSGANQAADSALALAGLTTALSTGTGAGSNAISAGNLFRDMGDRYVFSANGYAVAIVSGAQPLTNALYEGAENKVYLTTWCAEPGTSNATTVGVAKL